MTRTLAHRGPDDSGVDVLGPAGLGHTRLSIIDLSSAGHQPMLSDDRRVALVYNGEVYNFPEIRRRLEGLGACFRSHSDSEVVLRAYLQWGVESFAMLKGMFAMAIWDGVRRRLHLVRDRFGIKPLYYLPLASGVVFGSEVKALLASGRMTRGLNWHALHEYLHYGAALGGRSLFAGVRKLLPGHRVEVEDSQLRVRQYASIQEVAPCGDTLDETAEKVRDLLAASVKAHLVSDVPVGVFLSGGIDSSAITALAAGSLGGRLSTFSAGFDFDRGVNELPKARIVAEHFGTKHHELHISGARIPDVMEQLVRCHDEPFGDAANIPLYLLCRELRGTIKVVLQGDGGDEMFAGYPRYSRLMRRAWIRRLGGPVLLARRLLPRQSSLYRGLRTFHAMRQSDPSLEMALLMSQEPFDADPTRVFSSGARDELARTDPFQRYREHYERFRDLDPVQRMLYTDSGIILPDVYFEKVDKATMAHGIEVRVPMVDTDLAGYVMGLPSGHKVRRGRTKFFLRRALRGTVPDAILDGPKTGFGVPFQHWLREPLAAYMRSVLLDPAVLGWGLFNRPALERCMDEHISGDRDNGFLLNKLLQLALWHRFYLCGAPEPAVGQGDAAHPDAASRRLCEGRT